MTSEEFERLERPLRLHDEAIDEFARQKGAVVNRNYHDIPNRLLEWFGDGLKRTIQVSPVYSQSELAGNRPKSFAYMLAVAAYKDTQLEWPIRVVPSLPPVQRKLWHATIVELEVLPAEECEFTQLLEEAYQKVSAVCEDQLTSV